MEQEYECKYCYCTYKLDEGESEHFCSDACLAAFKKENL